MAFPKINDLTGASAADKRPLFSNLYPGDIFCFRFSNAPDRVFYIKTADGALQLTGPGAGNTYTNNKPGQEVRRVKAVITLEGLED